MAKAELVTRTREVTTTVEEEHVSLELTEDEARSLASLLYSGTAARTVTTLGLDMVSDELRRVIAYSGVKDYRAYDQYAFLVSDKIAAEEEKSKRV